MKIVVTGGAGFIGSHFVEHMLRLGFEIVVIDSFNNDLYDSKIKRENWESLASSSRKISILEMDLREKIDPVVFQDCDAIFHFAAMPGLSLSWTDTKLYIDSNLLVTCNVLEACKPNSNLKFFQISTSSVYGKIVTGDENSTLEPISPYGVTKLAAEKAVVAICTAKNLEFNILRLFSVYGPRQRPDMAFNIFIRKILNGDEIEIFGDGTQTRANTYVRDIVEGIYRAYSNFTSGEIYNLSGREEVSVNQILEIIEQKLNKKAIIKNVSERLGDQQRTIDVSAKALTKIGYLPHTDIVSGIANQVNWQTSNY